MRNRTAITAPVSADSHPLQVLFVEDCPEYGRFLKSSLEAAFRGRIRVHLVDRVATALAYEHADRADVVLLDLNLPDSSGLDTMTRIRSAFPDLPIVILTAAGDERVAQRALEHGAEDYLLKPAVSPDLIMRSLEYAVRRRRASETLRAYDELLRALVESSPLATIVLDPDGTVRLWNPAAERVFGWSASEVIGAPYPLSPDDLNPEFTMVWEGAASGQTVTEWETKRRARDGRLLEVSLSTAPLRDEQGRPVGTLIIFADLSEGKRALGALESERRDLEEQLRRIQRMEAIGRLAGGVAHDFNNVLMVIGWHTEKLLGDDSHPAQRRRHAEAIQKASSRAASLTYQLLAFARQQVLAPKVLDLNEVVANLEPMLGRLIGENIELVVEPGDIGAVLADPGQLEQVIMNLVVNARDAMPDGGRITIQTRDVELGNGSTREYTRTKPGPYVRMEVQDTGIGMDTDVQAKLFEPFFTTKPLGKGTGLGLSTAYGIVKQSGGFIWVESERGGGATFVVDLPRIQARPSHQALKNVASPERGSETVLLVEDEDDVRTILCEILVDYGYKVLEARHGLEAIEVCERAAQPVDLLVTDVVMPHMSGRTLAKQLTERWPSIRVLYLSGYTDEPLVLDVMGDATAGFLQKPFEGKTLAKRVREILDGRTTTAQRRQIANLMKTAPLPLPFHRANSSIDGKPRATSS